MSIEQPAAKPYQLSEHDFDPIEPGILKMPITTYSEDGGYVGWGHIPAGDFATAVNLLESFWGVVDDPRDQVRTGEVSHEYLVGSEVSGEARWQMCGKDVPGAVAVTLVRER